MSISFSCSSRRLRVLTDRFAFTPSQILSSISLPTAARLAGAKYRRLAAKPAELCGRFGRFEALTVSEATRARVHICHVVGARAVELIRDAKKRNPRVTAEVAPGNLLLCDKDLHAVDSRGKFSPPVKTAADRDALWHGFEEGVIDTMGTDHAPQITELKNNPNIWVAPPGGPGLESTCRPCSTR